MKTVDLHCDTAMLFYEGKHLTELEGNHVNLEKLQRGECLVQCFAIFVPTGKTAERHGVTDSPEEYFEKTYQAYLRELELCRDHLRPAYCVRDVLENEKAGFMSSILTVEDGVTLNGKVDRVDEYYRRGIRMVALTWNVENCIGFPQSRDPELHRQGLKPFGFDAVERMNELGIAVDVSHLSEGGFWDVARCSTKPFLASHACCQYYQPIPRNLTDAQIRAVADSGGVVGINYSNSFLHPVTDWKTDLFTSCDWVVKHLRHMADVGGMDVLALGSDYDGIDSILEWKDCGGMQLLVEAIEREFGSADTEKICRGNALRVLRDIIGS